MKNFKTFIFSGCLTLLTLHACQTETRENTNADNQEANTEQESPVKMIEQLVGEWEMDSIVGASGEQEKNQRLTFTEEARYVLHSGNNMIDSGAYRMNEQLRNLYLESETNKTPREFEIELQDDRMVLSAKQSNQATGTQYIYRRRN